MPSRKPLRAVAGLTLIEILVVISVIAILVGILYPIFFRVRKFTYTTVCASNLKQLGVAFRLYVDDWNGKLPSPGGLPGDRHYWAQDDPNGGLMPYVKNGKPGKRSVWCCPEYDVLNSRYVARTYTMNSYLRIPLPEYTSMPYWDINKLDGTLRLSRIKSSGDTILLFEGQSQDETTAESQGYVARCGSWVLARGYDPVPKNHYTDADKPVHRYRNNYLFCDGHVRSMEPEKYPDFRGPTCPENNHWFVERYR